MEKPVLEFLNLLAYRNDADAKRKADIERWKQMH